MEAEGAEDKRKAKAQRRYSEVPRPEILKRQHPPGANRERDGQQPGERKHVRISKKTLVCEDKRRFIQDDRRIEDTADTLNRDPKGEQSKQEALDRITHHIQGEAEHLSQRLRDNQGNRDHPNSWSGAGGTDTEVRYRDPPPPTNTADLYPRVPLHRDAKISEARNTMTRKRGRNRCTR